MSREDFVAVCSRLFAVFLGVYALRLVPTLFLILPTDGISIGAAVSALLIPLGALFAAALLWFFPLTVARKLLPVMKEPRSEEAVGSSTALSLALTAIGFWFLANAIVDSVYWLLMLVQINTQDIQMVELDASQKANIAATGVELILAMFLIFGSSGIRRIVERLRYAGNPPSSDAL